MNYLICAAGRRVDIVNFFKQELEKVNKKVYAEDQDFTAPALYYAHDYFISEKFKNKHYDYVNSIIDNCKKNNITNILSLHDYQIKTFSMYRKEFEKNSIRLLHSNYDIILTCLDKSKYCELPINQIPTIIIKDRLGSGSSGLKKIKQPFVDGKEYNVQCYFDINTNELLEVFIQEKLLMRAGETDRSLSVWDDEIYQEVKKLNGLFEGVIDIDVIKSDKVYIIDINTRFGGGYPFAHAMGKNYVKKLIDNVDGKQLNKATRYETGITLMKFNALQRKSKNEA